jgi:arsenate reductase (thioredoxin)
MNEKVLILCTGNSCRSQMAEGFLKSFGSGFQVFSAGTQPAERVNPRAVAVMKEKGVDIGSGHPKHVDMFLKEPWDYVITVCGGANESCPAFMGKVKHRMHIGFDDPSDTSGNEDHILTEFRRVRDQIEAGFYAFYREHLK